jgi:hypothetical protein
VAVSETCKSVVVPVTYQEYLEDSDVFGLMQRRVSRIFPDVHVYNDPYPIQFESGDWITVITRTTGTFTGEMILPGGKAIAPTV